MKNSYQAGFTLIELMIVVAIVGVLASIAVPQYMDYTVRARVSDGMSMVGPLKGAIEIAFAMQGPRTMQCGSLQTNDCDALNATAPVANQNVASIQSDPTGLIDIVFTTRVAAAGTLQFIPATSGTAALPAPTPFDLSDPANGGLDFVYVCRSSGSNPMPAKYTPDACK